MKNRDNWREERNRKLKEEYDKLSGMTQEELILARRKARMRGDDRLVRVCCAHIASRAAAAKKRKLGDAKTRQIVILVTERMKNKIEDAAGRLKVTQSDFVREMISVGLERLER